MSSIKLVIEVGLIDFEETIPEAARRDYSENLVRMVRALLKDNPIIEESIEVANKHGYNFPKVRAGRKYVAVHQHPSIYGVEE